MGDFLTSAVSAVTGSFSAFLTGIGSAVVNTFDSVFVTAEGGVSNIAGWGLLFLGIGLGTRLIRSFTRKAG